jgi:hypothetical protein
MTQIYPPPAVTRAGGRIVGAVIALILASALYAQEAATTPGKAIASQRGDRYSVGNAVVEEDWTVNSAHLADVTILDKLHGRRLNLGLPFTVLMKDGSIYSAANLRVDGEPQRKVLAPDPGAARYVERIPGVEFDTLLVSEDHSLFVQWSVIIRDGSNYVRQSVTLTPPEHDLAISRVELIDTALPGAAVEGTVKGSPLVFEDAFLGFEHPLSQSDVTNGHVAAYIARSLPLKSGQSVTYSSVTGVAHHGQMRRDFLTYVERERAHPYRTFLHYNSWYDLGRFNPYTETGALDRINTFGRELHERRGVVLDSFLFDDGWDDHSSLWRFDPKDFPEGFTNVRKAAEKYGTDPGIWMSPWGGYSAPKKERLEYGKQQGFEIVDNGFALSGPKYYERFREVCFDMIRKYGINQFKFDGTGNANSVFPGSTFDSDFSAAIHLIGELRQEKPDIYINLTTGTYPSPFWLITADSIWRGGEDDGVAGVGPYRERWITYRDADTYSRIVKAGPLYPLNSLMLHGMIYAERHKELSADPSNDFRNEIRSYFGTGTQLQEMYITPSLLNAQNWDDLSEAAKWSRANADVLKDTHWVGGDPAWQQVYGWASWSPAKAILVLRNPSDKPQSIQVDLQTALELPQSAAKDFTAHSPWKDDASQPSAPLHAGTPHRFELKPFEVLTLDLTPRS